MTLPTDWDVVRYQGNPAITTAGNPNEAAEQYTPMPFLVGSDLWVYVKGTSSIYAWKSEDDGASFVLQNANDAVIAPAAGWESQFTLEACGLVDGTTIHLWYKGTDDAQGDGNWGLGYATAPTSDPTAITKSGSNPIVTSAGVLADLGGSTMTDLALSDVVLSGSTYHFYGYCQMDGRYQLIHASGNAVDNPGTWESLLLAISDIEEVAVPSVFQVDGGWGMVYTEGTIALTTHSRDMKVAASADLTSWVFNRQTIMGGVATWENARCYAAHLLKDKDGLPTEDGQGRWTFFYSGQGVTGPAQSGWAYLFGRPSFERLP